MHQIVRAIRTAITSATPPRIHQIMVRLDLQIYLLYLTYDGQNVKGEIWNPAGLNHESQRCRRSWTTTPRRCA